MTGHRLLGLAGTVTLKITGACPEDCLTCLALQNIRFRQFRKIDELTICLTVSDLDISRVRKCAKKTMCNVETMDVSGVIPLVRAMGIRVIYPVVLLGILLFVFWIQTHILFFSVSGNEFVPTEKILWALENNGIQFGTAEDEIDLNTVKNQILAELPELGWITVNTEGGMAEVIVRERAEKPVISKSSVPANIVAKKSGLITDFEVTGGTAQVQKGSIVKEGDLLISGVTNLDKTLLLTRAEGEIYARTWNRVHAVFADNVMQKVYTGREKIFYSITFGKKTLNFYKTSGISYRNYDKIMESTVLALPGGYEFPITITKTVVREYILQPVEMEENEKKAQLEAAVVNQMRSELTAGSVLNQSFLFHQKEGGLSLNGIIECQEEIGNIVEIKD